MKKRDWDEAIYGASPPPPPPPKEQILDEILSSHRSCDRDTTIASHDLVTMKTCHGHSLHEVVLDQWLWPILTNEILCDVLICYVSLCKAIRGLSQEVNFDLS